MMSLSVAQTVERDMNLKIDIFCILSRPQMANFMKCVTILVVKENRVTVNQLNSGNKCPNLNEHRSHKKAEVFYNKRSLRIFLICSSASFLLYI